MVSRVNVDAMGAVTRRRAKGAIGRAALLLSTAALVAACAVGPDYQTPTLSLPGKWSDQKPAAAAPKVALAHWWERLGDPTLNGLIDEAVSGNLDVAAAKARVRSARATETQTSAALFPEVDGSASADRARSVTQGVGNTFKSGFDASWELDLFGANRRSAEAAKYGTDAAVEDLRGTLLTLVGDVATNYVNARGYQALEALAKRTAASQRETASLTRAKYQAGSSSAVDVANAEGQAANTEATIADYHANYVKAVHRLAVLSGRPPADLDGLMAKGGAIPRPKLPVPKGVPADILLNRPDVRLAERDLAQATAKIGAAEAARYPSISLTGSIATSADKVGDLGRNSSISWSFGPSVSVPIFNAGRLSAAVDVARASRDQYFVAYKSSVLTALEDVENASVSLNQQLIKNSRLTASARSYRTASELSRSLYEAGSSSFLDVLDAERSLYTAESALISSTITITTDYVALQKALGGGWDGTVDVSKPEVVDANTGPRLAVR